MSDSGTPPGWYPDPSNPSQQRYWDGTAWSDATAPGTGAVPGAAPGYGAQSVGYGYAAGPPPNNNLVWAILATLFCCLPAGIVSIVKAASVNGKWQAGDHAGAQKAADEAKQWAIISAAVGVVVLIIYFAAIASAGT